MVSQSSPAKPEPGHRVSASADPATTRRRFRVPFVRKISLKRLWKFFKKWIRSPEHFAVFIWLLFVAAVSSSSSSYDRHTQRSDSQQRQKKRLDRNHQPNPQRPLHLMAIYEHPKFCHHLILLLR
ncbi:hypothetical protein KSP40_PGU021917 [Platanthera guangdongensis]|uniref:Uncharacterized protein n=1 Tax=Platanthera guangdongensis TaxID=2320717 RepID=A0ABR2MAD1_9ASPA